MISSDGGTIWARVIAAQMYDRAIDFSIRAVPCARRLDLHDYDLFQWKLTSNSSNRCQNYQLGFSRMLARCVSVRIFTAAELNWKWPSPCTLCAQSNRRTYYHASCHRSAGHIRQAPHTPHSTFISIFRIWICGLEMTIRILYWMKTLNTRLANARVFYESHLQFNLRLRSVIFSAEHELNSKFQIKCEPNLLLIQINGFDSLPTEKKLSSWTWMHDLHPPMLITKKRTSYDGIFQEFGWEYFSINTFASCLSYFFFCFNLLQSWTQEPSNWFLGSTKNWARNHHFTRWVI